MLRRSPSGQVPQMIVRAQGEDNERPQARPISGVEVRRLRRHARMRSLG
jgi:hypothetical protein